MAAGERNARAAAERKESYRQDALRRRLQAKPAQGELFAEAQP